MVTETGKADEEALASPYGWRPERDPGASGCSGLGGINGLPQELLGMAVKDRE